MYASGQLLHSNSVSSTKLRVLLADDHALVREGLRLIIESQSGMEIMGEASDAVGTWKLIQELLPDVVVMDITMTAVDDVSSEAPSALHIVERVKAVFPTVKVLALSTFQDDVHVRQTLAAGASGFLLKKATSKQLVEDLRAVGNGGVYLDPSITRRVVRGYFEPHGRHGANGELSPRELEVLLQVAWGHTNAEIAKKMHLSVKTVEGHKAKCGTKLGLTNRASVMRYALRRGWLNEA